MNKEKIRISIVSYLNAKPFLYGLEKAKLSAAFKISSDIPSVCAGKLLKNEADIGLIPVAMIPYLNESHLITSYCIAADGPVSSVVLVSQVPLEKIRSILLDTESRTSVLLAKILARELWGIDPEWVAQNAQHDFARADTIPAAVIIGDKALKYKAQYPYCYDLSEAWKTLTGLPFVFAAWVSNKEIDRTVLQQLEDAFQSGTEGIAEILPVLQKEYPETDVENYLTKKIKYRLGVKETEALDLFLKKANQIATVHSGPVVPVQIK